MKNVMKEAHKLTREIKAEFPEVDYKFQLGLCISYLSKNEVKEDVKMVELKGTEKQIKWAEDIRREVLELLEDVNSKVLDKEQVPLKKIMINKMIINDYMNWNPEELRKKKEYRIATKKIIEDAIEKINNVEYATFFITYLAKNRNIFDVKDLFLNSLVNFIEYAK